jgi:hypothetical protein
VSGATTHQLQLHTVAETATILGLRPRTIREYAKNGELAAINVGTADARRPTLRIPAESLAAFLAARSAM